MRILFAFWLRWWHCLYFGLTKIMTEDHRLVNQWTYDKISHIACACGKVFYHKKFIDIYNEVHKHKIEVSVQVVGTAYSREDEYNEEEKQVREKIKLTDMKKVTVNGRKGHTTSIIPHSNGKYPVWYDDGTPFPDFVEAAKVTFEK